MFGHIGSSFRRFLADDDGSAGAEFVVSLPLLIGVMVIASEYGGALQVRDVLDSATRDATRFLARAPLDTSGELRQHFIDEAERLVAERVGVSVEQVNVTPEIVEVDGTADAFRTDYRVVTVTVNVLHEMPLLALLDIGKSASISDVERRDAASGDALDVTHAGSFEKTATVIRMTASDTARYTGEVPPEETEACTWVMQINGQCGGGS